MKYSLTPLQNNKIGMCPHGLPQGACPICSGMGGGGGGSSVKKNDKQEMSWSECYVAWQQMQKTKNNLHNAKSDAIQSQITSQFKSQISLGNSAEKIANLAEKLTNFVNKVQSSSPTASKILAIVAKIALPVLNLAKDAVMFADKALNAIKEKIADISDKLNAVFGELKNSIEKKISDRLKDFKKKIKSLFGINDVQDVENLEDEEKRVEESKRLFELKNVIDNIKEKFTPSTKKDIEDGTDSYTN